MEWLEKVDKKGMYQRDRQDVDILDFFDDTVEKMLNPFEKTMFCGSVILTLLSLYVTVNMLFFI